VASALCLHDSVSRGDTTGLESLLESSDGVGLVVAHVGRVTLATVLVVKVPVEVSLAVLPSVVLLVLLWLGCRVTLVCRVRQRSQDEARGLWL